ncbi:MAG: hypothetical protein KZQ81_10585 [Candidatus Thiodiazotropha sp. (ex Rostrolucina anterorostrata)]|nr:hypothetical protein [Candidatus Thiodiazotropha sp. (ex Rostrolucina anterorostrata)]
MSVKTERITILGTPDFKAFLTREAKKEGLSVSQLVRDRCRRKAADKDEELLLGLVSEVRDATQKAKNALDKGLKDAEEVLMEVRAS